MTWRRCIFAVLAGLIASCTAAPPQEENGRATRIVSIDYCADQYVLKLVDRSRILAVSMDAERPFSYMRAAAKGIPKVRTSAEDILALKPDLIVRAYGGGPYAQALFERAGIPVLNVGWSADVASIKTVIADMAEGLGVPERGAKVVEDMETRLAAIARAQTGARVLYMTPSGVTTGPGSHVHEMMEIAGLENFQTQKGWQPLPLERLAGQQPDLIAASFFDAKTDHKNAWSASRHPVARKQLRDLPTVFLEGAWTSCGGWYLLDAIEALADGAPGQGR